MNISLWSSLITLSEKSLKSLQWARSIQSNFPEISVQNSMDRFGPTGKVSKKRVHLLRWSSFPGRTGWNFGWMDRAQWNRLFVFAPLCNIVTQCWYFDWQFAPSKLRFKFQFASVNVCKPWIICLRADVSYFLCCTRKRDVCVTPSLIVFQRPSGRVFYFA